MKGMHYKKLGVKMEDFFICIFGYLFVKAIITLVSFCVIDPDDINDEKATGNQKELADLNDSYKHFKAVVNRYENRKVQKQIKALLQAYDEFERIYYIVNIALVNMVLDLFCLVGLIIKELFAPSLGVFQMIHNFFSMNVASVLNHASALTLLGLVGLTVFATINIVTYVRLKKRVKDMQKNLKESFDDMYKDIV